MVGDRGSGVSSQWCSPCALCRTGRLSTSVTSSAAEVDGQRGGPGEVGRTVPFAAERREVLEASGGIDHRDGACSQRLGELVLAVRAGGPRR